MNFKSAYKSYNDEIKGDPKVLDAILNGKKESKKIFYMRPSFVGAAAAMVVIAVSVFGFGGFNNNPVSPQKTYIAARNTQTVNHIPEASIVPDNEKTTETKSAINGIDGSDNSNNYNSQRKNNAVENNTQNNNSYYNDKTVTPWSEYEPEANYEQNETADIEDTVAALSDDEPLHDPQAAFDGVVAREQTEPDTNITPAVNSENVTSDECYEYFGFNVTEKAKLPHDMTFGGNVIIKAEKSSETGEIEYCSFSIDAYSETDIQRVLDVCVTKQNTNTPVSEETQIYTSSQTGEVIGGSATSENVSVTVNSQNVSQTEVGELIDSLK